VRGAARDQQSKGRPYRDRVKAMLGTTGSERLPMDLRHFVVFFDHHGSVETIARSYEVQE
jgi:hypothetical protein